MQILTPNPQERPSLHDIVDHAFFTSGIVPGYIPMSAREMPPDFSHTSPLVSLACGRHASSTARTPLHLRTISLPHPAPVAPTASHNKNVNSRRQYSPAVQFLRCSAVRGNLSWSHRAVSSAPGAENQHCYANCKLR